MESADGSKNDAKRCGDCDQCKVNCSGTLQISLGFGRYKSVRLLERTVTLSFFLSINLLVNMLAVIVSDK